MKRICCVLIMLFGLYSVPSYSDEVRLSIGINLTSYPELEVIPGYPVYYAPQLQANYFFYDGDYWLYQDDNWYESEWYDGPWRLVEPEDVPVFILRIPVRYYRLPPVYFFSWIGDEPPRWAERWGHDWEEHRRGWDRWDHRIHLKPAPLPLYQRQYVGERYPRQYEQQHELQLRHYHFQSHDPLVQQRRREQSPQRGPVRQDRRGPSGSGSSMRQDNRPALPPENSAGGLPQQRREVIRPQRQERQELRMQDQRDREDRNQDTGGMREQRRGQEQDRGRDR